MKAVRDILMASWQGAIQSTIAKFNKKDGMRKALGMRMMNLINLQKDVRLTSDDLKGKWVEAAQKGIT